MVEQKKIGKKTANKITAVVCLGLAGAAGMMFYHVVNGITKEERLNRLCERSPAKLQSYSIENRTIDQIFRDHNGYRLYSHTDNGLVTENKYYQGQRHQIFFPEAQQFQSLREQRRENVTIYRDLPAEEQAFARILTYTVRGCTLSYDQKEMRPFFIVDVHLPRNMGLAAGIDSYIEGKITHHEPMVEVR